MGMSPEGVFQPARNVAGRQSAAASGCPDRRPAGQSSASEAGSEFKLSDFDPEIQAAINAGYKDGWLELQSYRDKMGEKINGWQVTYDLGRYGTKYAYRAAWTFMAIGGLLVEDALYPLAREDGDGQRLTGANNYTLHFSK